MQEEEKIDGREPAFSWGARKSNEVKSAKRGKRVFVVVRRR